MTVATRRKVGRAIAQLPIELPRPQTPETRHVLKGNSGATIVLHAQSKHTFVRKTAANRDGNDRLLRQAGKQHDLARLGIPLARVLASGIDDTGLAFFDMEYVPGRTVADAVANAALLGQREIAQTVERMLSLFRILAGPLIAAERFHDKIEDVVRVCANRQTCEPLLPEIGQCAAMLHACDWAGIPMSPCHGDLTLENILISNEQVRFIDCDDAWVSSYWLDVGKLFQDLDGHWCIRRLYGPGARRVRLANALQKLERLAMEFRRIASDLDSGLPARLPQLGALGLFRALPYSREDAVTGFICRRINSLLG